MLAWLSAKSGPAFPVGRRLPHPQHPVAVTRLRVGPDPQLVEDLAGQRGDAPVHREAGFIGQIPGRSSIDQRSIHQAAQAVHPTDERLEGHAREPAAKHRQARQHLPRGPVQAVERAVCGCDYGGTSWATQGEADQIIGALDLGPWEQIFYGEFDGRRTKRVMVKIIGE